MLLARPSVRAIAGHEHVCCWLGGACVQLVTRSMRAVGDLCAVESFAQGEHVCSW